jgi:hypothetical protein
VYPCVNPPDDDDDRGALLFVFLIPRLLLAIFAHAPPLLLAPDVRNDDWLQVVITGTLPPATQ